MGFFVMVQTPPEKKGQFQNDKTEKASWLVTIIATLRISSHPMATPHPMATSHTNPNTNPIPRVQRQSVQGIDDFARI